VLIKLQNFLSNNASRDASQKLAATSYKHLKLTQQGGKRGEQISYLLKKKQKNFIFMGKL
jgi:hypothetical protein